MTRKVSVLGLASRDFGYLVTPLVLTLAACGSSTAASPAESPDSSVGAPADSAAPTAAAPAASAPAASTTPNAPPDAPAPSITVSPAVGAAVNAPDRSADDRALDAGRKPELLLSFFGVAPGQRVAELGAGGGYTAELVARVVGKDGRVFGQNPKVFLERFAEKPWSERLQKPLMANVTRADREFDAPLPPEAKELDAVLFVMVYHDTVWMGIDRARMNRAVFDALKPGGIYGIVDHSGRPGTGTSETQTLHRIEESALRDEVTRAGFVLDGEAPFFRNPSDARDWNASPRQAGERRGSSDRFVLRFKKPK